MSEIILYKVQDYLNKLNSGEGARVDFNILNTFAARATTAFRRTLDPERNDREFRLRMSNLGRASCQLQAEKLKYLTEPIPYAVRMRNMFGDIIEAGFMAIMKAAGVNIVQDQGQVSLTVAGQQIDGTYDVIISENIPRMYDIKTASGWSFRNKYQEKTLQEVWKEDSFGYVPQLYCYAEAKQIPVGGLLVVNKENGEIALVGPPVDDSRLREEALKLAASNVTKLASDAPFEKNYEPIPEFYRRKPTGKFILDTACTFCNYRGHCWPTAEFKAQEASKGVNPRKYYYVPVEDVYKA